MEELYPQELIDEYLHTIHELEESISDKREEIKDLQHQLAVKDRALDMMSIEMGSLDGNCLSCKYALQDECPNGYNCDYAAKDYFIEKAEKVLSKKEKN